MNLDKLDKLEKLEVACRILEQGFKDERSMLDDGMIEYAQEVCGEAGTIRALIREHFAMRRALGDILQYAHKTDTVIAWVIEVFAGNYI